MSFLPYAALTITNDHRLFVLARRSRFRNAAHLCVCSRARPADASWLLPALACAADDLERTAFYASGDLDAEKLWRSRMTVVYSLLKDPFWFQVLARRSTFRNTAHLCVCSRARPADASWLLPALACAADDLERTAFFSDDRRKAIFGVSLLRCNYEG
eukprot:6204123-Pleurochrysis_carterae.AAC.1